MKSVKKLLSVLMVIVFMLLVCPIGHLNAEAYSVSAAVAYANAHWNDGVGLCAEFVSNCLKAGGIDIPDYSYYSSSKLSYNGIGGTLGGYTNPYTCSEAQLVYFSEAGYRIISDPSVSDISPGDVVFMHGNNTGINGRDDHVGICINNSGSVVYAAHNRATNSGTFSNSHPCTYVVKMTSTVNIPEGVYVFHCVRNPDRVLDIQFNSTECGANIQLYNNWYNQVQKFRVVNMGEYYCIQSVYSDLWLDISYPYDEDGCNIQLWDTNTRTEQKWVFEDAGNGNVYIRSLYGMYLDTGGPTDNSTNIQTYHFDGTTSCMM